MTKLTQRHIKLRMSSFLFCNAVSTFLEVIHVKFEHDLSINTPIDLNICLTPNIFIFPLFLFRNGMTNWLMLLKDMLISVLLPMIALTVGELVSNFEIYPNRFLVIFC